MTPEEHTALPQEETERWPALSFYTNALEHLAPGAVFTTRIPSGGEVPAATEWTLDLSRGSETWHIGVDPGLARPGGERPFWRKSAILALLDAMRRNLASTPRMNACPSAVRSAWSLLVSHPTRPMSLGEVAAAVNLSAGHLGERFEEIMGSTFRRAMRDERIAYSIQHLEQGAMRISEIAAGLGGQSLSQYNRNFVAATGITPSEWRDRFRDRRPGGGSSTWSERVPSDEMASH